MRSSNLLKYIIALIAVFAASCGACRTINETMPDAPPIVSDTKNELPFATKEPDAFQTEIAVTANGAEDKFFVAKSGAKRLTIFDFQTPMERSVLQLETNQNFLIDAHRKIYVEAAGAANAFADAGNSPLNFLTGEWTNQKSAARFETLGAENDLKKIRVSLDDSKDSEIIVWFDEKMNLPVKQEFYQTNGDQKILTMSVELKNFSLQPDAKFFELPADFKKVSTKDFQTARHAE